MIITKAAAAALFGVSLLAIPVPASAAARGGCSYPHVCLYKDSKLAHPTGRFQDITSYYQRLTRSRGAHSFVNTRHNDAAHLLLANGGTICVGPNATGGLLPDGPGVVSIRITD